MDRMKDREISELILNWFSSNDPKFDTKFVKAMLEISKTRALTENQYRALEKMVVKFDMLERNWPNGRHQFK